MADIIIELITPTYIYIYYDLLLLPVYIHINISILYEPNALLII